MPATPASPDPWTPSTPGRTTTLPHVVTDSHRPEAHRAGRCRATPNHADAGATAPHRPLSEPLHAVPQREVPMGSNVETLEFQAETRQLLRLVIHSIYSNKDIFLRELISNASDALDKLRLESLTDSSLETASDDLHISLEVDPEARTLTVRDNGIGMTRDDLVELIGTIAKSGTAGMLEKIKESQDAATAESLIGQFGVGFYSAFMVADKVTLCTRRAGDRHGHPVGVRRRGHLRRPGRRRPGRGHLGHPAPQARRQRGRARRLPVRVEDPSDREAVLGLHPLAHPHGHRTPRRRRRDHPRDRHAQLDEGTVGPASHRGDRGRVQGVLPADQPRLAAPGRDDPHARRRHLRVRGAAVHPLTGALRPVLPRVQARRAAVRQAGVHHGRLRSAHAQLPALRQGCRGRPRPVAERLARDPPARPADSRGAAGAWSRRSSAPSRTCSPRTPSATRTCGSSSAGP